MSHDTESRLEKPNKREARDKRELGSTQTSTAFGL